MNGTLGFLTLVTLALLPQPLLGAERVLLLEDFTKIL